MDARENGISSRPHNYVKAISGFLLVSLFAFTFQLFYFSPISPDVLQLPSPSSLQMLPTNHHLQGVIKIGEGLLKEPEAICVDEKEGKLYTATRDGWIKRLHPNGTWEDWRMVGGPTLLGITYSTLTNHILACDVEQGVLKVGEECVTVLASHVNGSKIRFADDVIMASDGTVYFTVASTKFMLDDWYLDMLEAKPHGQLLRYDPLSKETSILLDHLGFANGVTLSRDQDYLVVCESWKFRCLKHWLKGAMKGETEVFVDNLPGGPDNINLAPDGTFWIALIQLLYFSPISPDVLQLPPPSSLHMLTTNHHLQGMIKIGEGVLKEPEAICVDEREGKLYTATRDGWIKRLHPNGTWEDWRMVGGPTLLGITYSTLTNHILACDSEQGLLKVGEDGVTVLASHVNGTKIRNANDVIMASDGTLYFTVSSTRFKANEWYLDMLEAKPNGQLLRYDPSSNETSILLDHLSFANGVALSKYQDYLVVCESWKLRCLKHWLKGGRKGETEVFVDGLPGGPDNISLAPDGTFWIALVQLTRKGFEFVHTSKASKRILASSPKLMGLIHGFSSGATVVKVTDSGEIIKLFHDPNGRVMSFVTSAVEFENHLYLGSLTTNFIGKLPLENA